MYCKLPVRHDRHNITRKIFLAYLLAIHPDITPIIASIYIQLMRNEHIMDIIAAQLFRDNCDYPLRIQIKDSRIFKNFIENRPYRSYDGNSTTFNKFYETLWRAVIHSIECDYHAYIRLVEEEFNQKFCITVMECECNKNDHVADYDDYYIDLMYIEAVELLWIAHSNSCVVENDDD